MKNRSIRHFLNNAPVVKAVHYKLLFEYHKRWFKVVRKDPGKKEIRMLGMRRTGNHAFSTWILNQHHGLINFCNDLVPMQDPAEAFTKETRQNHKRSDVFAASPYPARKCLLYSYEDQPIEEVFSDAWEAAHDKLVGPSAQRHDCIIVRDPFNLFASWTVWQKRGGELFRNDAEFRQTVLETWKSYAREALGETNYLRHNKLVLNYNRWVTNKSYRQELASALDLHFTDEGINTASHDGKGSSFNTTGRESDEYIKGVLSRWHRVADDPVYRSLWQDAELIELSERLFGPLEGTEQLVK